MPRPKWSVMIPTFNCAHFLAKTLESVLAQYPGADKMQITVVDDHSTNDDPESVVNSIGKGRVEFFRQPFNVGAPQNFNTCIELSRGHFVHILHGDDWLEPSFYETVNVLITQFPEASLFSARFYYVDESGIRTGISPRVQQYEHVVGNDSSFFTDGPIIHFVTSVFRRSFFEQKGWFNHSLIHAADWEMWVRAVREGGIAMTPEVLGNYRVFANNDTGRLMKTAENLVDRERCITLLAARYPDFDVSRARLSTLVMCEKQEKRFKNLGDLASARNNRAFWNRNSTFALKIGRLLRECAGSVRSTAVIKRLTIK
jgi:glycosyltransferase involved in cell wall biosynthesis